MEMGQTQASLGVPPRQQLNNADSFATNCVMLNDLHNFFQFGIAHLNVNGSDKNIKYIARASATILPRLHTLESPVEFTLADTFKVRLTECSANRVTISVNNMEDYLDISLKELLHRLISEILENSAPYPMDSHAFALHYALDMKDAVLSDYAVTFIITHDEYKFCADFIDRAAKYMFLHSDQYHPKDIKKIARAVVMLDAPNTSQSITERANAILKNQENYSPTYTASAAIILADNFTACLPGVFALAARFIALNAKYFQTQFIAQAACHVVEQNYDFFSEPCIDAYKFVGAVRKIDQLDTVERYSHALVKILQAKKNLGLVIFVRDDASNTIKRFEGTLYELWIQKFFKEVLSEDRNVARFILYNSEHKAIIAWNFYSARLKNPGW